MLHLVNRRETNSFSGIHRPVRFSNLGRTRHERRYRDAAIDQVLRAAARGSRSEPGAAARLRVRTAGRNGAGKSTALKMLVGIVQPDYGHVELLGEGLDELELETRAG